MYIVNFLLEWGKEMKQQLFYIDPYKKEFTAQIEKQEQTEEGKWYDVLDQTAFYPTGGGQPYDEGFIENEPVLDVQQVDGEIRHFLTQPLLEKEGPVKASINWERRFDHMQQHAGNIFFQQLLQICLDLRPLAFI